MSRRGLALLVALLLTAALAPVAGASSGRAGSYIVVLDDSVTDPGAIASEHARVHSAVVGHVYRHALKGYAATIPDARLERVRADDRVDYVVADGIAYAATHRPGHGGGGGGGGETLPPQQLPWGVDAVDADRSSTLAGDGSGAVTTVNVYVIDSGIDERHADLAATGNAFNSAGGRNTDCSGHGTHVAGTAVAKDNAQDVVGVAPGAAVTGVKVLNCNGTGSWSGVIAGIDWVTANAVHPAVANMSLSGGANQAVDDAVLTSVGEGILYAVAAGNNGTDACTRSPARAGDGSDNGVITVAATNSSGAETSWSNFGSCVDIWAPGESILSTKRGGGTTTMSGTSMSSPHVAGGAALYLSSPTGADAEPIAIETALKAAALPTGSNSKDAARTAIRVLNVAGF